MTIGLCRGGKFRLVRPGVLEHWCVGCCGLHHVDLSSLDEDGKRVGWNGSFEQPSFGGPVRHMSPQGLCEYELRGGVLHFSDACWHPLAGQTHTLEDIPT